MDEKAGSFYATGTSYAASIETQTFLHISARVEVVISNSSSYAFRSKAAYISFRFASGFLLFHNVDTVSENVYGAAPTIAIECVDGGASGYFRVVFSGLTIGHQYDYKIVTSYILYHADS